MKICPACGELGLEHETVCGADQVPLTLWRAGVGDLTEVDTEAPNKILCGRYELHQKIGSGGYGAVFAATDLRLQKPVAVKVLSPVLAADQVAVQRFRREALAASRVRHEGIVDVTDVAVDEDGMHFLVMEFLEGRDLAQLMAAEGALPPQRALSIAAQVASALEAAHQAGILHRDLKPSNIYLTSTGAREDVVKVIDFGISKITVEATDASGDTTLGEALGTPLYMAPEQARGESIDHRGDIYSLGAILYEILSGARPFASATVFESMERAARGELRPLSGLRPDLGQRLDALVMKAMAREPDARFASMGVFRQQILECWRCSGIGPSLQTTLSVAPTAPPQLRPAPSPGEDRRKRRRLWRGLLSGAALTMGLSAVGVLSIASRPPSEPAPGGAAAGKPPASPSPASAGVEPAERSSSPRGEPPDEPPPVPSLEAEAAPEEQVESRAEPSGPGSRETSAQEPAEELEPPRRAKRAPRRGPRRAPKRSRRRQEESRPGAGKRSKRSEDPGIYTRW